MTETQGRSPLFWTNWQLKWAVIQIGLGLAFFSAMLLAHYSYTSLLLTSSIGFKMLVEALVWLLIGVGGILAACWVLDRRLVGWHQRQQGASVGLYLVLAGVQFIVFFMPVFFVVRDGPIVIQISQTLLQP
jgi:hypothetical protein